MERYLPALFVMSVFTLLAGLVVAGATRIHQVLGRMMLALAWGILILLAFAPGMHVLISLLGASAIFACHTTMLPDERQRRADEAATRRAPAPPPAPVLPAKPRTPPDARAAVPCPGCGSGTRPGGTCAYCGRHV
jgi:hypothetical protein